MGDPKKQRKKYKNPRFTWSKSTLDAELRILGEYGLRNKKELRHHHFALVKYRTLARKMLAKTQTERAAMEKQVLDKLISLRMVPENSSLDEILDLTIDNILERRLQTLVYRKGLSKTPQQARQLIVHGHITVNGEKVTSPSYLVNAEEERNIQCMIPVPLGENSSVEKSRR